MAQAAGCGCGSTWGYAILWGYAGCGHARCLMHLHVTCASFASFSLPVGPHAAAGPGAGVPSIPAARALSLSAAICPS
eukprot:779592-Prymnesium_polylepis.1